MRGGCASGLGRLFRASIPTPDADAGGEVVEWCPGEADSIMTTIHGTARKEGVAIAVAAIVDARLGVSGVSPELLAEGLAAIRRMAEPVDYPECVVICDTLAMGASVRIPGVSIIGIAAQSEADAPGLEPEVPCVIGLEELPRSVSHGDIVILDGNKGIAHIDPDPRTLMHYQEMEERHDARPPVYIESEHIPARTQSGDTVTVYAVVQSEEDLPEALHQGADGLLVEIPPDVNATYYERALSDAAGKPVAFATGYLDMDLPRAAMRFASPAQVMVLFPLAEFGSLAQDAAMVMENIEIEAMLNDLDPPRIRLGAIATQIEAAGTSGQPEVVAVDLREASQALGGLPAGREAHDVILILGDIEAVPEVVRAGARCLAVAPGDVAACKYAIRCIGSEGEE